MFRSLSISASSIPFSKSSAASFYDSSSKSEKWENFFLLSNWDFYIDSIKRCEISVLEDGSGTKNLSEIGIGILNLFGGDFDYPDHWFLIAKTEPINIIGIQIFASLMSSFAVCKMKKIEKEKEEAELNKIFANQLLNRFQKEEVKEGGEIRTDQGKINSIYECELKEVVEKLKNIKDGKDKISNLIKFVIEDKRFTKVGYFLIEKGSEGKIVKYYNSEEEIFDEEEKTYYKNEIGGKEIYQMKYKETTIKNIRDYVKTLSDSYNLIDDNCQVFVRKILSRFCFR